MYKNINVEAEHNELILENSNGDKVIIPANKRNWVKQKLSEGCHGCIDSLVETLPVVNNYAQDGTVFPNEKQPIVLITPSGRKVETNTDSDFYRTHYNSKLIGKQNEDKSWSLTDEIYQSEPLPEVVVTSKIQPNTFTDYNNQFNKNNPKDKFLQAKQEEHNKEFYSAPLWAQQAVGGYNDKRKQNDLNRDNEEYKKLQNDFIAEKLLKRTPSEGIDNRLKWMSKFSPKELETIKNSKYANEIEPSIWSKFEQGLLSVGNMGSPVQFKNPSLSQEEAKKEDNPLNILQPLNIPSKMVQSAYKDNYSFTDALKGKQNNAGIVEDIVTDPLNLVGVGLVGKLSKADKVIDATKAVDKISDISKPTNRLKFDDFQNQNEFFRIVVGKESIDDIIKTGQIRVQRPSSYKTEPGVINLDRRGTTPSPSFSKGKPSIEYAKENPEHYIIRTSEPLKPSTMGAHGKGSTMFPTDEAGKHLKSLDASKTQVYKHIGNGEYELVDITKAGNKVLNKTDDAGKNLPLSNTIDNQLPELPHEIILDNNTINLERLNPKNKKQMLSFDDVDLGSDLTLRNNPSRVADQNTILGKNRSIKSVLNKKTNESIDLKTWQDTDGKIYYYMSASMPSSKIKAGRAYKELEKHIPKGESLLENSSLSYDSFLNILKQTKNPKFETFVKGRISMNDNAKNNLLKIKGDSQLGSNYFNSEELANSANKELIELTNKYSLPNPSVVPVTSSSGKIKAYEIQLPNIGLKKLYTILGLTSVGTYLQSQQNKSEQ